MEKDAKIYVAGHRGLVGSALCRRLKKAGYTNVIHRTSADLDLRRQVEVENFFGIEKPDYVFLAAAKVGGIHANNTYPGEFIYDNLAMQTNVIHTAYMHDVKKLMFLGSSCIYPKFAPQPMREEYLLSGDLEPTNEPYAVAKIAGMKMCEYYNKQYGTDFLAVMPTNLYGPNDNFDLETSHVLPALIRKFHEAKEQGAPVVEIWGTGKPRREFLHVDDLADACVYLMERYTHEEMGAFVNIGTGKDVSIYELAQQMGEIIGYKGEIVLNPEKPDGTPRKLLDISRLAELGWSDSISLWDGIAATYEWYKENEI
ncbi:GDP-L-fucose synthase [Aneurinibacillus aneurinilyticus]|uniref:GDP-L-fucose synthase n=1 Tax=Aneurinibacillus aneurinilyticus TaxID=1391 RepID=UPI002E1CDB0B|nr:GDP-L-fucose synthase [Aneurinibacillus aneurinilyticus]